MGRGGRGRLAAIDQTGSLGSVSRPFNEFVKIGRLIRPTLVVVIALRRTNTNVHVLLHFVVQCIVIQFKFNRKLLLLPQLYDSVTTILFLNILLRQSPQKLFLAILNFKI